MRDKAYPRDCWLPLSSPAFDKDIKPYAFDPEKAKKLLTEAGFPMDSSSNGPPRPNESWGVPIVEAVIPMLAKVGVKVKIKPVEGSVLRQDPSRGRFPGLYLVEHLGPGSADLR